MLITGKRVPLASETFDSTAAKYYDEHARRFMLPVYRDFRHKLEECGLLAGKILDLGSGSALLAIELARSGSSRSLVAVDVSLDMLRLGRGNLRGAGEIGGVSLIQGDVSSLPLGEECFDLVVSNASLHAWRSPGRVFSEINRVLKRGGYCLIRDNMRVPYFLYPAISLAASRRKMDTPGRGLWWTAILASYTLPEARKLLEKSALKGARVSLNYGFLDLEINWRKPG